jgi:hypothetical protein
MTVAVYRPGARDPERSSEVDGLFTTKTYEFSLESVTVTL